MKMEELLIYKILIKFKLIIVQSKILLEFLKGE